MTLFEQSADIILNTVVLTYSGLTWNITSGTNMLRKMSSVIN